jgi:hypothetical protein
MNRWRDSMKGLVDFVKTTIVGGLIFLVPALILIVVMKNAIELIAKVLVPIEKLLPFQILVALQLPICSMF